MTNEKVSSDLHALRGGRGNRASGDVDRRNARDLLVEDDVDVEVLNAFEDFGAELFGVGGIEEGTAGMDEGHSLAREVVLDLSNEF